MHVILFIVIYRNKCIYVIQFCTPSLSHKLITSHIVQTHIERNVTIIYTTLFNNDIWLRVDVASEVDDGNVQLPISAIK